MCRRESLEKKLLEIRAQLERSVEGKDIVYMGAACSRCTAVAGLKKSFCRTVRDGSCFST